LARADLPETVTIRILESKRHIYPEFKKICIEENGSDVCFVLTNLMESWIKAWRQIPVAEKQEDPIQIKFMRQNVQINIGSNIYYQPKKARRYPEKDFVTTEKNYFYQEMFEQWKSLSEKQKDQIKTRLKEEGILEDLQKPDHHLISTGEKPKKKRRKGFFVRLKKWLKKLIKRFFSFFQ